MKIYKQLCEAQKVIDFIGKDSKNTNQNFNFRGIDQIYNQLHNILADFEIICLPEVLEDLGTEERKTTRGGLILIRRYKIKYTFATSDGSTTSCVMVGEAQDTGDKATNKCFAIAHKYALLQMFTIPTEESKDPDGESVKLRDQSESKRFDEWFNNLDLPAGVKEGWIGEVDAVGVPYGEYSKDQMSKIVNLFKAYEG